MLGAGNTAKKKRGDDISKMLKENNRQPRILYPTKLSFKNEGEIKTFPDRHKLRKFTRPPLQEISKGVIQVEMRGH